MGANAGSVEAKITGDSSGFTKAAGAAAEGVEAFAKRAKRMANDFAVVGAGITAGMIAIVSKVQNLSPAAHVGFEGFTSATQTLGIQLATIALPALKSLSDSLKNVANWLAGLSPATKAHLADWIVLAAQVAVAAVAFGRVMELVKGLTILFEGLTVVLGVVFSPVGLAIAAVIAGLLVLRKAWNDNWGGIREATRSVISDVAGYWSRFVNFLGDMWKKQVDDAAAGLKAVVDLYFAAQKMMSEAGLVKGNPMAGLQQSAIHMGIDAAAGTAKSPMAMGNLALEAGKALKAGALDMAADFKKKLDELLKGMGLDLTSNPKNGTATVPENPEELAMRRGGAAEQRANMLADAQRGADMARRQRDFGNIGRSTTGVEKEKTSGFDDFNDALKKEAAAIQQQEQLISAAKMMELRATQLAGMGNNDAAAAALDSAAQLKLLAQQAGTTAQTAEDAAQAFVQLKEAPSQFAEGLKLGGEMMTRNLGQLGTVINDVAKGWQQGGIWGALIAFVMDLLSMVDGWKDIQAIANGQLKMALKDMASGLGSIINGLKPVMGAVESIAGAVHGILNPILVLIGKLLAGIAPVLEMVGLLLSSLAPIIDVICNLLGAILTPIFKILGPILTVVAETFLFMKLTIEYTVLAIYMFIDALEKIGGGSDQGDVNKTQADIDATKQQMIDLANQGLDGLANSSAAAAEQLGKAADSADKLSQALTNVPEGFKTMFAEYTAQLPVPNAAGGAGSGRSQFIRTGVSVQPGAFPRKKS